MAELALLEVLVGLHDLGLRVHHEGAGPGDGLADRPTADDDDVEVAVVAVLPFRVGGQLGPDAAFTALDPFFAIVQQGLAGLVDGDHYFDTIADDAEFEFRYHFPGWPQTIRCRDALMALYAGYGNNIVLHGADELVVHRSQDPRVVIIEYDVHGKIVATGSSYDNRFISVVTIEGRKIVQWRDYMDSLAAMTALSRV